ncbi:MAG: preprotein translocase subunit YajC [Planctomycetes bacterium]|nr:preprotein translocase subunit YajC [Planctomycetota bacterium]MBI3844438.1 preprotein translocase subunit YajC [Planctomycetota bacterium]
MIDVTPIAAFLQTAPASDAPATAAPNPMAQMIQMVVMFGGIVGIMWFLVIRPQKKQQKERQAMLSSLRKNDKILSTGGIYGVVMNVKDDEVVVRIDDSANIRVKMARSAVAEITSRDGEDDEKESK